MRSCIFVVLQVLAVIGFSHAGIIEMKCLYNDLSGWYNLGPTCDLQNRGAISELNVGDTVQFTGLTDAQRDKVRTILWRTGDVDFVPKEAFTTFPNLDCIGFHDTKLETIDSAFFRFFPANHKISYFYFWNSQIKMIDPNAWPYMKNANRFQFQANPCITGEYRDTLEVSRKIQPCIKAYRETVGRSSQVTNANYVWDTSSGINEVVGLYARSGRLSDDDVPTDADINKQIHSLFLLLGQYLNRNKNVCAD